jgi:hypothetical protein
LVEDNVEHDEVVEVVAAVGPHPGVVVGRAVVAVVSLEHNGFGKG